MSHRTKAERKVDALVAEQRRLRALPSPTEADRARIREITATELPKAWKAVRKARENGW